MSKPEALEPRALTLAIDISADTDAVWRALTDATELTRWFSLEAQTRPGAGGSMRLSWGDPVAADWQIEVWNPGEQLCVSEIRPLGVLLQPRDGVVPTRRIDFRLERHIEATRLHLVHTGFGCGPAWAEVFSAVRRGWEFQLRSLRHYLERHAGVKRSVVRMRRTLPLPAAPVWSRLMGANGLLAIVAGQAVEGCRCNVHLGAGQPSTGLVQIFDPPRQFVMTLAGLNDALFRIYIVETAAETVDLTVWLASYGAPVSDVEAFELRLAEALDGLLSFHREGGAAPRPRSVGAPATVESPASLIVCASAPWKRQ